MSSAPIVPGEAPDMYINGPDASPKEPLPNGFKLSQDGTSASKTVKFQNMDYIVTVHFKKDDQGDPKKIAERLNIYTNQKLESAVELAYQLGLGKEKDLQQVSYHQDADGKLKNVTKHLADGKTATVNEDYFQNLRKNGTDEKKVKAFEDTYNKVKNFWNKTHSEPQLKEASNNKSLSQNLDAEAIKVKVNNGTPKSNNASTSTPQAPTTNKNVSTESQVNSFEKIENEMDFENEIKTTEEEIIRLGKEIEENEIKIAEAEAKLSSIQKEISLLEDQLKDYFVGDIPITEYLKNYVNENKNITEEELHSKLEDLLSSGKVYKKIIEKPEEPVEQEITEEMTMESEIIDTEKEINRLEKEIEDTEKKITETESEIASLQKEKSLLAGQLKDYYIDDMPITNFIDKFMNENKNASLEEIFAKVEEMIADGRAYKKITEKSEDTAESVGTT